MVICSKPIYVLQVFNITMIKQVIITPSKKEEVIIRYYWNITNMIF